MPHILHMIGQSWEFARKQSALTQAGFWFLVLPILAGGLLTEYEMNISDATAERPETVILFGLLYFALALVTVWGDICILVIGKRLLQAKSGRSRSSFKAVCSETKALFFPYVLTSILRSIFTFLWSLLLIIPGIVYGIRTILYPVVLVCEGKTYRECLDRSKNIVKGQFWPLLGSLLILSILLLLPAQIFSALFTMMAEGAPPAIVLAAHTASAIVVALSIVLYTLCLILLYGHFKPKGHVTNR
jgi:uncharacterized membrane protein